MGFDYFKIVYLGARGTEVVALCGVIGMVANFVRQTNQAQHQPPAAIMALLVSSIISFFWIVVSVTQYDDTHIPYFVTGSIDGAILIVFAVFAILLGQPMSMALSNCYTLPSASNGTFSDFPVLGSNNSFVNGTAAAANTTDGNSYLRLEGVNAQTACLELNAVWGLTIALAICFFFSGTFVAMMWVGKRRSQGQGQGGGDKEFGESQLSSLAATPRIGTSDDGQ